MFLKFYFQKKDEFIHKCISYSGIYRMLFLIFGINIPLNFQTDLLMISFCTVILKCFGGTDTSRFITDYHIGHYTNVLSEELAYITLILRFNAIFII